MRRSIQYISSIFLGAVLLFSGACTREDLTPTPPGDRVALSEFGINYQVDGAEVYTKMEYGRCVADYGMDGQWAVPEGEALRFSAELGEVDGTVYYKILLSNPIFK